MPRARAAFAPVSPEPSTRMPPPASKPKPREEKAPPEPPSPDPEKLVAPSPQPEKPEVSSLLRENTGSEEPVQNGEVESELAEQQRRENAGMLSSSPFTEQRTGSDGVKPSLPPPLRAAAPLYRENERPVYPRIARQRGYEGTVLLDVLVTREGRAVEVDVAKSCGHRTLDEAAQEAVREWRFEPAKRGDEAVDMRVRIPVRFQLR